MAAKLESKLNAIYRPRPPLSPTITATIDAGLPTVELSPAVTEYPLLMPSSPLPPFNILPPTDDDDSDVAAAREPSPAAAPFLVPIASPVPTPPATAESLVAAAERAPTRNGVAPIAATLPTGEEAEAPKRRAEEADAVERKAQRAKVAGKRAKEKEREKARGAKAVKRRSLGAGFR